MSDERIIVCFGPDEGETSLYRCPCCGVESDSLEDFAMSTCWPCAFGGNLDCTTCVAAGVWVDRFPYKGGKGHRFARWTADRAARTSCGLTILRGEIGQATEVRQPCRRCWPDEGSA